MRGNTIARPGREGGPSQKIEVRLQETWYRYRVIREHAGVVSELPANDIRCYELVSDSAYSWANFVASASTDANYALFSLEDSTAYLCSVGGMGVRFADVTRPRDRIVAFQEHFNPRVPLGPPDAPVYELVPGSWEWGEDPWRSPKDGVRILAVERDADGALVLTVKDSTSPAAAVLVLRDGEWALLHDYPDGLPEAPPSQPEPGDPDEAR
jgi:hypothetical protein